MLDRHGWSASKLWNGANYYARQQWDETGEIPNEKELKRELKTHPKDKGLHNQSSQTVLEELSEAFSSWFGSDDDRDNPPGYRKRNYYDNDGILGTTQAYLQASSTWRGLGFVLLKFWLGILSFVLLVTFLGTAIELLLLPVFPERALNVEVVNWEVAQSFDSMAQRILAVAAGVVLGVMALHILNALARATAWIASSLLGPKQSTTAEPPEQAETPPAP